MSESSAAEWRAVRRAFEELVDLEVDARADALAALQLAPELRRQVEQLLASDRVADSFLDSRCPMVLGDAPQVVRDEEPELPRFFGRYELRRRIGSGGMGEVYLALDRDLNRSVALKMLAPKLTEDAQWLARFRAEARATGGLNHPNVVTIHDIGEVAGQHFLTTEFIDGTTLRRKLEAAPLDLRDALEIALQVVRAMAAAHAAGIVHRDLKPENVMQRRDGVVKVLDFGLAKITGAMQLTAMSSFHTQSGVLLGTLSYMSPEQARGLSVDARSDVFSLGVLLYELLTGKAPFSGPTPLDVLVALLDHQPISLQKLAPTVPAAVVHVIERALSKDVERRPRDAGEFLSDLEAATATIDGPAQEIGSNAGLDAIPEVHYASSGDVNIAYQVLGSGPIDLVFVMGWISHLEYFWREPSFARFLRRLAQSARVILFDKRGTGLSDRVATDHLPTLEQRMDDVRAVLDQIGSQRAVLCGISEGGPMCSLFAATYPLKTIALIMIGSYARRLQSEDYPWGPTVEAREHFLDEIRRHWGGPVGIEERAPSRAEDPKFRAWWAAYLRHGASPNAALALTRMNAEIDVRGVLPTIRVPTLVIHRRGDRCLRIEEGRYLAQHIPAAKLVELDGIDHLPFVGDQESILRAIEAFLVDAEPGAAFDRQLATVLVARISGSTDPRTVREIMTRWRGTLHSFEGDQFLATFDGPARAVHAARGLLSNATPQLALQLGIHTGECEIQGSHVRGTAVDLARAVRNQAQRDQLLVSSTVRDLAAGAGIPFRECGTLTTTELGELRLYEVGTPPTVDQTGARHLS